jgi:hypothetical protein
VGLASKWESTSIEVVFGSAPSFRAVAAGVILR